MCVAEIPREARTLKAYGQQKRLRQRRDLTNGCKSPRSLAAQRQASAAVPSMTSSIVEKIACYVNHGLSTTSRARRTGARAGREEAPTRRSAASRNRYGAGVFTVVCGGPPEAIAAILEMYPFGLPLFTPIPLL